MKPLMSQDASNTTATHTSINLECVDQETKSFAQ
jgi:hypothetical protein